jgi:hypothetical protein
LSRRSIVIGTILVLFSFVSSLAVFTSTYTALQSINPAAAVAAITVAIIGIAWFKKTIN